MTHQPRKEKSGNTGGSAPCGNRSASSSAGANNVRGGAKRLGGSRSGSAAGPRRQKSGNSG